MADLTDEAKAEIKAAIDILKSDGVHIHKAMASFLTSQGEKKEDEGKKKNPEGDNQPTGEGDPPPKKEEENEPPKKRGLWWGDQED